MAQTISDTHTVTAIQARRAILKAFGVKRPVFLHGPPGIGKSDVVREITEELGGYMIDMRMAQLDVSDIRGIPYYNKDLQKMVWAEPVDLPSEEFAKQFPVVVLFLDEMNSAAPAVQASAYQLILNRRVGSYVLPDNVVIVAAGNRKNDKGVTYNMPSPLANRFIHVEMRYDFAAWQEWAVQNNVHKDVVGYLAFSKGDGYDFDPRSPSHSFATPRSWCFVSDLINDEASVDEDTLYTLIAGSIGDGLATKFMAHRRFAGQMPSPEDILDGKVTDLKMKEISAMYALTIALCYELKERKENGADRKTLNKALGYFFKYMTDNFEPEISVMAARILMHTYKIRPEIKEIPEYEDYHRKYGRLIIQSGTA